MKMLWSCKCETCGETFDDYFDKELGGFAQDCPRCGSYFTVVLPGGCKNKDKAKDPYDYLERYRE